MIKLKKKTESLQKRQGKKKQIRTIFEKSKHGKFRLKDIIKKKTYKKIKDKN